MASQILVSKISEPYADALLELAKSNNCVDAITAYDRHYACSLNIRPMVR